MNYTSFSLDITTWQPTDGFFSAPDMTQRAASETREYFSSTAKLLEINPPDYQWIRVKMEGEHKRRERLNENEVESNNQNSSDNNTSNQNKSDENQPADTQEEQVSRSASRSLASLIHHQDPDQVQNHQDVDEDEDIDQNIGEDILHHGQDQTQEIEVDHEVDHEVVARIIHIEIEEDIEKG